MTSLADRARLYVERAVELTLDEAARAGDAQNDALNVASFKLGRMVGAGWIREDDATRSLHGLTEKTGYAQRERPKQITDTIQSGLSRGVLQPYKLPHELREVDLQRVGMPGISPEAIEAARAAATQRDAEAREHRRKAQHHLERADYHERVAAALRSHADAQAELQRRRIDEGAWEHFGIGWDRWPTEGADPAKYGPPSRRPSIVLPWREIDDVDQVRTLQYRHLDDDQPKIHWHHALGGGRLFHPEAIASPHDDTLMVVEGALNAATLWSAGMTSVVALPQMRGFGPEVQAAIEEADFGRVLFIPDPNAIEVWADYAERLPNAQVARLPTDPDDLLLALRGDVDAFWRMLRYSAV